MDDIASSAKILTVFLPRFSCLFCFLSSRILQNNFLHLYLVKIRRYKLSFFAKPATKSLLHFSVFKKSWREANNRPEAGTSHIIGHCKFIQLPVGKYEGTQNFLRIYFLLCHHKLHHVPDGCYYLALLTNDIIGSYALAKTGLDFRSSYIIIKS